LAYKAIKDMVFFEGGSVKKTLKITAGTLLQEAHWSEMNPADKAAFQKMEKRHKASAPNERLGFFHYGGRIRSAVFNKGIIRTRRAK
jgi:hypothetical protein